MISPADLRSAFASRGIRINPPADGAKLAEFSKLYGVSSNAYLVKVFEALNGFDEDFDGPSFIQLWTVDLSIQSFAEYGPRGLIPFSDFSFSSDVYCASARDCDGHIWGEVGGAFSDLTVVDFFSRWVGGRFDLGIGAIPA